MNYHNHYLYEQVCEPVHVATIVNNQLHVQTLQRKLQILDSQLATLIVYNIQPMQQCITPTSLSFEPSMPPRPSNASNQCNILFEEQPPDNHVTDDTSTLQDWLDRERKHMQYAYVQQEPCELRKFIQNLVRKLVDTQVLMFDSDCYDGDVEMTDLCGI